MSTSILDIDTTELAARIFRASMDRGASVGDDICLKLLHGHTRQYMHGICTLMAIHLHESRNLPVILLEGRHHGEGWFLRHAAVGAGTDMLTAEELGDGMSIEILDAAGAGTFADRIHLYESSGMEFRVIYAEHTNSPIKRLMALPGGQSLDMEDDLLALPGLCHALGMEFDARRALEWLLDREAARSSANHDEIAAARDILLASETETPSFR